MIISTIQIHKNCLLKKTILKTSAVILLWCAALHTNAQQMRTQNFASAGSDVSTGGTQRLISVIGQPIAYSSSTGSETKAGFLQVAGEVITDNQPPVLGSITAPALTKGINATFTAAITDNIQVASARLFFKPITSAKAAFQNVAMTGGTGNVFTGSVPSNVFDNDLGLEYYVEAKDAANNARAPLKTPTC